MLTILTVFAHVDYSYKVMEVVPVQVLTIMLTHSTQNFTNRGWLHCCTQLLMQLTLITTCNYTLQS